MTIFFGGFSSSSNTGENSNSTITGSSPPDIQVGELMLAQLVGSDTVTAGAGGGNTSAPSGWATVAVNNNANGNYATRQLIAWKIFSGEETDEDFTFTVTEGTKDDFLVIQRVYGSLDYSNPILSSTGISDAYSSTRISPSIVTDSDNRTVIYFTSAQNGASNNPDGGGEPIGTTLLYNIRTRPNSSAVRSASAHEVIPVAGETGAREWDGFTSQNQYGSEITIVINSESDPDPDPDPEIDPTGTDTNLVNGSSQQISFTGLTATPTSVSLVHGGNVFTQPNFSIGAVTEGVATAIFTAAIGNLPYTSAAYPASGFSYLVTDDNDTELTLSGITINPSADRSVVTAVNPVNDSFSIIPSWVEGGAVTGDQIDWPKVIGNIEPTVNPDFSHRGDRIDKNIPWPDSITFTVNYWDSITSIRYAVTVEVAYAEDGSGTVIGITTRELTSRSLTVRNLTMRSL